MAIVVSTHARIRVEAGSSFESIREVLAARAAPGGTKPESALRERLSQCQLQCQKGSVMRSAESCLACPRIVNFVPKDEGILVRCLWSDDDAVEGLMTLQSELVTVAPHTSVLEADGIARRHGVRHLLVVEEGRLSGVLCRCDLAEPADTSDTIMDRANHCPWTIGPDATLAQAAKLMRNKKVGMLPVVHRRELLGIITRGDLRRAGVDESLLGAEHCEQCHNRSGVLCHPDEDNLRICLSCLDESKLAPEAGTALM